MARAYLEVFNVSMQFGDYVALKDINLLVERGEFVSLIGHSGCGKSTLLSLIAGLARASRGGISLDNREIKSPGSDRAMVFQNYSLLPWMNVYQNVYIAVDAILDVSADEKKETTEKYLKMVGLWDHREKRPAEISGGMKQRVAIARAFAVHPKVLLLDEPFGALDPLKKSVMQDELITIWEKDKKTVLMVTHDIDEAIYLSDRIVVMTNGPAAGIGEIIDVKLERPRSRKDIMRSPVYTETKEHLLYLLSEVYGQKMAV
ncbi:MAG: ABC transporter ATP-binding protein [Turneriella sp.]